MSDAWKLRVRLFLQRLWQPTGACMTCMPGSWMNAWSLEHWNIALHTGVITGLLAVVLSFTPVARLFRNRFGNALVLALLTVLSDAYAHPDHYGSFHVEALVTGLASFVLALAGSYVFEDRARRVRAVWAMMAGRRNRSA